MYHCFCRTLFRHYPVSSVLLFSRQVGILRSHPVNTLLICTPSLISPGERFVRLIRGAGVCGAPRLNNFCHVKNHQLKLFVVTFDLIFPGKLHDAPDSSGFPHGFSDRSPVMSPGLSSDTQLLCILRLPRHSNYNSVPNEQSPTLHPVPFHLCVSYNASAPDLLSRTGRGDAPRRKIKHGHRSIIN